MRLNKRFLHELPYTAIVKCRTITVCLPYIPPDSISPLLCPAPVWLQDNSLETVSLSNTCKTTWLIFCCRINWPEAYRQVLNSGPTSNCCLNDLPTACLDTVTDSLS